MYLFVVFIDNNYWFLVKVFVGSYDLYSWKFLLESIYFVFFSVKILGFFVIFRVYGLN